MITVCPHCQNRVLPTAKRQCPSCRRDIDDEPEEANNFRAVKQNVIYPAWGLLVVTCDNRPTLIECRQRLHGYVITFAVLFLLGTGSVAITYAVKLFRKGWHFQPQWAFISFLAVYFFLYFVISVLGKQKIRIYEDSIVVISSLFFMPYRRRRIMKKEIVSIEQSVYDEGSVASSWCLNIKTHTGNVRLLAGHDYEQTLWVGTELSKWSEKPFTPCNQKERTFTIEPG